MTVYRDWDRIFEEEIPEYLDEATSITHLADLIDVPRTTLRDALSRRFDVPISEVTQLRQAINQDLPELAEHILGFLQHRAKENTVTKLQLCDRFDRGPGSVQDALDTLYEAGYNVEVEDTTDSVRLSKIIPREQKTIPIEYWTDQSKYYKFGVISDTHLCNRNARMDVLNALYDKFEQEGVEVVFHAGNLLDGETKYNSQELLAHGVEGQVEYLYRNYPERNGIVTKFITGECHEGRWAKTIGLDIGRYINLAMQDMGREDIEWVGHIEADIKLAPDVIIRLMHPGGGTSYALSYQPQKWVESLQGGEKPNIAVIGHYHKYGAFYMRNVYVLMPGTTEDQTIFMRKKRLAAHVGGCILEVKLTPESGLGEVHHHWFPFYDRGYYNDWTYRDVAKLQLGDG